MKYLFIVISLLSFRLGNSQPLRDINYVYQYDPGKSFDFDFRLLREADTLTVFYKLQLSDTAYTTDDFIIQWEGRETLGDKESTPLTSSIQFRETQRSKSGFIGNSVFHASSAPKVLVARIINSKLKRAWLFYKILDSAYPVNGYAMINNVIVTNPFVQNNDKVSLSGEGQWVVSYYNNNFPAALPPFAEAQGRVSKGIKPDSTFRINAAEENIFSGTGLYLVQKDTAATEGFSFRSENDYPKLAKITSLAGPLIYICTKQEYDRLILARNDKKSFDRIILSITNDTERARKLMRTYFRRVEIANQYFTSYKEGWKTDRGMIFIVFGLPDEVFKFSDREVWTYKNEVYKATFNFSKSGSLFDPENYVLIRDKKFRDTWYEVIDLWRNSRF